MRALDLRIPPVALVLMVAALMWLVSWGTPEFGFGISIRISIAVALAVMEAAMSIAGVVSFRRAGTTVNPLTPAASSTLVRSGVYAFSRNPMYLGFLILLLAWGIYLSNALVLVFPPLFVIYMNRLQIEPEDRALRSRFGQEFVAYASHVRR